MAKEDEAWDYSDDEKADLTKFSISMISGMVLLTLFCYTVFEHLKRQHHVQCIKSMNSRVPLPSVDEILKVCQK